MTLSLADLVTRYDRPGPRYTGYPMPPAWRDDYPAEEFQAAIARANARPDEPLSMYLHVPFCKRRCTYCGCNVTVSPKYTPVEAYLQALEAEVELWSRHLPDRRNAIQLHWGGGTPTYLEVPDLQRAFHAITRHFPLLPGSECSIEVDPTFLRPDQLPALRALGFNRVSFGVQDLDDHVQELINRGQTWAQTLATVKQARELGFSGVNLDLVYGLPGQTLDTFRRTLEGTLELRPDRMAIYGFAYLPKMLANQRVIDPATLPPPEVKLDLLLLATEILEQHGYVAIGMDHFAEPNDPLAKAVKDGRIIRNFMGYAVQAGTDALGFGPSAISDVGGAYMQNEKLLIRWERAVTEGRFAIHKGLSRTEEDQLRRWVIHRIMGTFELKFDEVDARWGIDSRTHFAEALVALKAEEPFDVVKVHEDRIEVLETGKRFVRNLVMPFDAYLPQLAGKTFSRTV